MKKNKKSRKSAVLGFAAGIFLLRVFPVFAAAAAVESLTALQPQPAVVSGQTAAVQVNSEVGEGEGNDLLKDSPLSQPSPATERRIQQILTPPRIQPISTTVWGFPGDPANTYVAPQGAVIKGGTGVDMSTSKEFLRLSYDTDRAGWAGGGLTYDDSQTPAVETSDFSALDFISFGVRAQVNQVKFEVVDDQNRKAVFYLQTLSRSEVTFRFTIKELREQKIDVRKIRTLYFIVEGQNLKGDLFIGKGVSDKSLSASDHYGGGETLISAGDHYSYRVTNLYHCGRAYCPTYIWLKDTLTGKLALLTTFAGGANPNSVSYIKLSPKQTMGGRVLVFQGFGISIAQQTLVARIDDLSKTIVNYDYLPYEKSGIASIRFTSRSLRIQRLNGTNLWVDLKTLQWV